MLLPISTAEEKVETSSTHYISIPAQLYADLCEYVKHYDTEVSGCGMVERFEHRYKADEKDEPDIVQIEFRITDVYLPNKQKNTKSTTDIDDDTIAELMTELLQKGKNTEHLRMHWHSHCDMDTFHSGTDEDNYATLSNGEFLISLVLNKAQKVLGRIDYFKPLRVTISGVAVYLSVDQMYKPSEYAVSSIQALDKYTKEENCKVIATTPYYGSGYGAGICGAGTYESNKLGELTGYEIELCKELKLSEKKARKFKNCNKTQCSTCNDISDCNEFGYHTGGYDY